MEREDSVGHILWRATETGRVLSSKGCVYLGVSQKHFVPSCVGVGRDLLREAVESSGECDMERKARSGIFDQLCRRDWAGYAS